MLELLAWQANCRCETLLTLDSYTVRLMIWEAAFEPRIVHLKEYELPQCHHQLRYVRSDTITADRCVDESQPGETRWTCCDPKYKNTYSNDSHLEDLDREIDDILFEQDSPTWPGLGLKTSLPIPSLLHACQDSRRIALKFYNLSFATLGSKPQVYFNLEYDTIYLNEESSLNSSCYDDHITGPIVDYCHDERTRVQNVALDMGIVRGVHNNLVYLFCDFMSTFANVKRVTFVLYEYKNQVLNKGTAFQKSSLTFLPPIQMDQRIYMFQNQDFHVQHFEGRLPRPVCYEMMDAGEIDSYRRADIEEGGPEWPMPAISHAIITTSAIKANFKQLKQQYERTSDCRCYKIDDCVDDSEDSGDCGEVLTIGDI
jgi:hypothetical protein